jgi:hypothetical protein
MIILHRVNTIDELDEQSPIEFDVRAYNSSLIVQHDPFKPGEDFEVFIQVAVTKSKGKRFMIVNIKTDGIEDQVLYILRKYKVDDFFLLDCSLPTIVRLIKMGEKRIAIRYSGYESKETVFSFKGHINWIWVDCFTCFPLDKNTENEFHEAGFKLCLVSPELQSQYEKIDKYISYIKDNNIKYDAVCTKKQLSNKWLFT